MWSIAHVSALVISVAAVSCATNPPVSCPPPSTGTTQALMLRTDPPGASCSVLRGGAVVAALKARLEAEAGAQRTRIDESCRPWPCTASELACPSPDCVDQRARVDADLASRLDQLPDLRARVRIVAP